MDGYNASAVEGGTVVVEVSAVLRNALIPLFAEHRRDRAFIDCVLEGRHGTAYADDETHPTVARVDCGPFTAFAGDPTSPCVAGLIGRRQIEWVTPETDAWASVLETAFAQRIRRIPFTAFSAESLDITHLNRLAAAIPPEYSVHRVDASRVERWLADLEKAWVLEAYGSVDEYLRRGLAYIAVRAGRVVCAAASAVTSSRAIDIDVETAAEHRNRGLATCVAATLAIESLVRGLEPQWYAANEASCRLAERLGYVRQDTYDTFEISSQ